LKRYSIPCDEPTSNLVSLLIIPIEVSSASYVSDCNISWQQFNHFTYRHKTERWNIRLISYSVVYGTQNFSELTGHRFYGKVSFIL
jgi:hypothetical protein